MAVEFHLGIYDPEVAAQKGKPADVTFALAGATADQARAALPFLRKFTERLERFITEEDQMALTKHGDKGEGKILPEPGDEQKTAAANFTDEDRKALADENAEDDAG